MVDIQQQRAAVQSCCLAYEAEQSCNKAHLLHGPYTCILCQIAGIGWSTNEAGDGQCAGAETPTTLRMQLQVQIGSMAAALDHDDGSQIVHSGMQNLQSKVKLYPETKEMVFSVEGVGVVAPNGSLLETGAPHKRGEVVL